MKAARGAARSDRGAWLPAAVVTSFVRRRRRPPAPLRSGIQLRYRRPVDGDGAAGSWELQGVRRPD